MNSKILSVLLMVTCVAIFSCKKKEKEEPESVTACFAPSKSKVYPLESITFTNCSGNAGEYQWEFGDGTTSTEVSPTKSWTTAGTYTVTLTAYLQGNITINSTITATITVGKKYLTKIRIEQMPATNSLGNAWDTGSAADLKFYLGKKSNTAGYDMNTSEATDATYPYEWNVASQNIELTNEDWKFKVVDVDTSTEEEMGLLPAFNPSTTGSNGVMTFSSSNSNIKLYYDFK